MAANSTKIDLELWLDQNIILRQNALKSKFWEILTETGNSVDSEILKEIHPTGRGVKLSKGNDLAGYPYQVLDLVRDFDLTHGLNIRLLNWFGHGLFFFVLLGKNHPKAPMQQLKETNWKFDQSHTPWEYKEILLKGASTNSPTADVLKNSVFYQWHKAVLISGDIVDIKKEILDELKKLIFLLSQKVG